MKIHPLNKEIYNLALKLGVQKIELNFSGGSDEGYLDVVVYPFGTANKENNLTTKIEEWAWNVYSYSGAGDGNDYGDDVVYDLEKKTVHSSEWSMVRHDSGNSKISLQVD